jgi:hypothetical protein
VQRVYSSDDRLLVGYLHDLLTRRGIACLVRNDYLAGGAGELPPNECWPELWVVDDRDRDLARRIVHEHLAQADAPPWTCPGCGERIDGQFAVCWHCGCASPDSPG